MVPATPPPPLHTVDSPTRTKTNGLTRRRGARSGHRSRSTSRHRSPSDDSERDPEHKPYAPAALEAELRASYGSSAAVDRRGLGGGVASSLRSSWSMSSAIMPPMPNGEAVPTLLSHLAGAFGYVVLESGGNNRFSVAGLALLGLARAAGGRYM